MLKKRQKSKCDKIITGIYCKSYHYKGIIGIPKDWVNYNSKYVYCAKLYDKTNDTVYLAFYDTHERFFKDTGIMRFNCKEKEIQVLERSRHRRLPFTNLITLPKSFCVKNADVFERRLRFIGAYNRFEVWKEDDYTAVWAKQEFLDKMFDMNIDEEGRIVF